MAKTGIDKKQLKNWFTNARRRIWKPMLKKQMDNGGGGEVEMIIDALVATSWRVSRANKKSRRLRASPRPEHGRWRRRRRRRGL